MTTPTGDAAPTPTKSSAKEADKSGTTWVATTHPWTELSHADLPAVTPNGTQVPNDRVDELLAAAAAANVGVRVIDEPGSPTTVRLSSPSGVVLADNLGGISFPAVTPTGTPMTPDQAELAHLEASRVGVVLTEQEH